MLAGKETEYQKKEGRGWDTAVSRVPLREKSIGGYLERYLDKTLGEGELLEGRGGNAFGKEKKEVRKHSLPVQGTSFIAPKTV